MSTTPRTDEAIRLHRFLGSGPLELDGRFADFARTLEIELDAAIARAEKAEAALQKIKDVMREDSNGKDPMDAVQDIITATKEASK